MNWDDPDRQFVVDLELHHAVNNQVSHLVQVIDVDEATDVTIGDDAAARNILRPLNDIVCFHDADGAIRFATANFADALGRPAGWFSGRRLTDPELAPVAPDGRPLSPQEDPVLEAMDFGEDVVRTIGMRTAEGAVRWYSARCGPVGSPDLPARSTLREVTDLIEAQAESRQLAAIVERELSHRADHDSLTQLKARHVVIRTLEEHVEADEPVSVVFIDLDGFRSINEKLGHVAGDEVLSAVADRLRELAPVGATLGRNGGDEFVAIVDDDATAERFAADVQRDSLTVDPLPSVHASVGVSHRREGDSSRSLLERADDAMYEAKRGAPRTRDR
jgi:diguanylate cyclase (GGDEF)-like protein